MSRQYKNGKLIVRLSGMLFISAFVFAIATGNADFSAYMILISWLMFIIGGLMIAFSSEEKERSAKKRTAYEQAYKKRIQEQKRSRELQKEYENYETLWIDVEILDFEMKMRKAFLVYTVKERNGEIRTNRTNIKYFFGDYNLNKIVDIMHIGNFRQGDISFRAEVPLFLITYCDGSKDIIKVKKNSNRYLELLSLAGKSPQEIKVRALSKN